MKMIFRQRLFAILLIIVTINVSSTAVQLYTDSITGVILSLPDEAEFLEQSPYKYQKCKLSTPEGNLISIYSVVNPDGEAYSWDYLNKFDKSYGKVQYKKRLENGLDGWIRYYSSTNEKGKPYITCVILIRGGNYAFYIVEDSFNEDTLISSSIVEKSIFPKYNPNIKGERNSDNGTSDYFILLASLVVLCILLWFIRKKLSENFKFWFSIIIGIITFIIMYWPLYYKFYNSIGTGICAGIFVAFVLFSTNRSDLWKRIENTFSEAFKNIN